MKSKPPRQSLSTAGPNDPSLHKNILVEAIIGYRQSSGYSVSVVVGCRHGGLLASLVHLIEFQVIGNLPRLDAKLMLVRVSDEVLQAGDGENSEITRHSSDIR